MMYLKIKKNNQVKKYKFQHVNWLIEFIKLSGKLDWCEIISQHPHDGNYKQIYPMQIEIMKMSPKQDMSHK